MIIPYLCVVYGGVGEFGKRTCTISLGLDGACPPL